MADTTITVFGSSSPKPGSTAYETAYDLGKAIAARGWHLCNGGYGGTMEASAKGAHDHGGSVTGVTCSIFGRSGPNAYLTHEVATDNLYQRVSELIDRGDAYVVLPGGTGTLVELALVWELINKRFIAKRLVAIGPCFAPLLEIIRAEQPGAVEHLTLVDDVSGAINFLSSGPGV